MAQLRFIPFAFAASAVMAFAVLAPRSALAQACDTECARGFTCEVVGSSGCSPSACPPGRECPPPQPCEVTEERACVPAACSSSADCAEGMVCHEFTESCPISDCACPPGESDCACAQAACDPQTVSMCTPTYALPCEAASDCGDGFDCMAQQCGGSGGGEPTPEPVPGGGSGSGSGEGSAGAGGRELPAAPDYGCDSAGPKMCEVKQLVCATDIECPTGWFCQESVSTSKGCPAGAKCPEPAAPVSSKACQPPYYYGGSVSAADDSGGPGAPTSGYNPKASAGPESANDSGSAARESSSCQLGATPASGGTFSMLVALGALLGLRRRRQHAQG